MEPDIRPLTQSDLEEADRICRLSFGTFLGLADPMSFFGDADYVHTRYHSVPSLSLGAYMNGKIVGSNFITNWGSVGIFGPLTVHPDLWDKGIAKKLMEKTMEIFDTLNTNHIGLFTFANSPKHIHFYQKYEFWPRFLTAVMSKSLTDNLRKIDEVQYTIGGSSLYSDTANSKKSELLDMCKSLTSSIYDGLDLTQEISSISRQELGDTIFLWNKNSDLIGLALCHYGAGTEAGSDTCYIKFGATVPDKVCTAADNFQHLIDSCESFALSKGSSKIIVGINFGNLQAYKRIIGRGFRTDFQGILMTKDNVPGYHKEDLFVIDDWR